MKHEQIMHKSQGPQKCKPESSMPKSKPENSGRKSKPDKSGENLEKSGETSKPEKEEKPKRKRGEPYSSEDDSDWYLDSPDISLGESDSESESESEKEEDNKSEQDMKKKQDNEPEKVDEPSENYEMESELLKYRMIRGPTKPMAPTTNKKPKLDPASKKLPCSSSSAALETENKDRKMKDEQPVAGPSRSSGKAPDKKQDEDCQSQVKGDTNKTNIQVLCVMKHVRNTTHKPLKLWRTMKRCITTL